MKAILTTTLPRLRTRSRQIALVPATGVTGDWLDAMILAGRLFIGSHDADHAAVCAQIRSERGTQGSGH